MNRKPSELRGAILGTLLGDSYLTREKSGRVIFSCEQASKNLVDYKESLLRTIPNIKIARYERIRVQRARVQRALYTVRAAHPIFEKFHKKLYIPTKQVTFNTLSKLTPEGIALWYMDDGMKSVKRWHRWMVFCTDSFDEFSHKQIIRFFNERYQLNPKIIWHRDNKYGNKRRICFVKHDAQKLVCLIYPYIIPEFYYKINLEYTMPFYTIPEYKTIQDSITQYREDIV